MSKTDPRKIDFCRNCGSPYHIGVDTRCSRCGAILSVTDQGAVPQQTVVRHVKEDKDTAPIPADNSSNSDSNRAERTQTSVQKPADTKTQPKQGVKTIPQARKHRWLIPIAALLVTFLLLLAFIVGTNFTQRENTVQKAEQQEVIADADIVAEQNIDPPAEYIISDYEIVVGMPEDIDLVRIVPDEVRTGIDTSDEKIEELFDGYTDTFWQQTIEDDNSDISIGVNFVETTPVRAILVWNGDQRSSEKYAMNYRAKEMTVSIADAGEEESLLLPLEDSMEPMGIVFSEPVMAKDFRFIVDDIYKEDSVYQGLVLSEIAFYADSTRIDSTYEASVTTESPDIEEDRQEIEEEEQKEDQLAWASAYLQYMDDIPRSDRGNVSVILLQNNYIPVLILESPDGQTVTAAAWRDGRIKTANLQSGIISYNVSYSRLGISWQENTACYDQIYELNASGFRNVALGMFVVDSRGPLTSTGAAAYRYYWDSQEIRAGEYFSKLESEYYSGDVRELNYVAYDDAFSLLEEDPENWAATISRMAEAKPFAAKWSASYIGITDQIYQAPVTGEYRFSLYGASGGGDGYRDYDSEGAGLTGTVRLKAGQRLQFMVGQAGSYAVQEAGVVNGGFNGGGKAYWSGGGGGCTDVYLEGIRIAAAAGGGGGNFDVKGVDGRRSTGTYANITGSKFGAGDGSRDAGGGGGGWFGGTIVDNGPGYGGINGWDTNYVYNVSERTGDISSVTGSHDGSASIEFLR